MLQGLPAFALTRHGPGRLAFVLHAAVAGCGLSLWPRMNPCRRRSCKTLPHGGAACAVGPPCRAGSLWGRRPCRCAGQGASRLLAGTLALGAVSFARLGNTAAPQTFVEAQSSLSVTATVDGEAESLMVYQGITQAGGQLRVAGRAGPRSAAGTTGARRVLFLGAARAFRPGPYTVTVTGAQVFELAFLDASGQTLPVCSSNGQALFDEQGPVPARPSL